jgi:hypothetical protein
MHPAILGIALGTQLAVQVSDHVPNFHMQSFCKAVSEDTLVGTRSEQTYTDCLSDEKLAQQKLGPIWSSYSAAIRAQCTGDTIALGMNSYLDVLACLQMKDDTGPNPGSSPKPTIGKRPPN